MENELSFARKINFEPLLLSAFFGIVISTIVYSILPKYPSAWILCGVLAFILESMLIYPRSLSNFYGYWKINDRGIYYYDYSTWEKRILAIFLPGHEKITELPFSDIKAFSVIDGKSIMNTQYPLGGALKAPLARKIHYLVIETNNREIKLNFAWKSTGIPTTSTDIDKVVELLNSKIG